MNLTDQNIRLSAFAWLKNQSEFYEDGIPREILAKGFEYHGDRITLVGPRGIWKPRQMELPLTITTTVNSPYDDALADDERFLNYNYFKENPMHADNLGLRKLMQLKAPLIYFCSFLEGFYTAIWPVYIIGENQDACKFKVDLWGEGIVTSDFLIEESEPTYGELKKSYGLALIQTRQKQRVFRERVLQAYKSQCSLCRLKHRELLDAAHIIGDREERGDPIVQNGISLCKIHHAAFDKNIIGISPDFRVQVRKDILMETDGPMLRFGIQELNGIEIILPERKDFYPDKQRLGERFERFLLTG